ncbi:DNA repair protein complementing XP-A cells isoform X2 [Petromyzon marinus]|uniref:DNA repair protein complementing XP-A cells isoform X2 n=1 Tax=Petromyzon marinus TaxID=7757 RepID=UPI003F70035A
MPVNVGTVVCSFVSPMMGEELSEKLGEELSEELGEEMGEELSEQQQQEGEGCSGVAGPGQSTEEPAAALPAAVRAQIERNRQRALLLRQARAASQPYPSASARSQAGAARLRVPGRAVDTGGGFLLEEADDEEEAAARRVVHTPAPVMKADYLQCGECGRRFMDSYLSATFDLAVCDACRDNEGKHQLVSRTEAKTEFLLKDCDLDGREPALRFVLRKNPHNPRWGDMKLYLRLQVEGRSLDVWGGEEALQEAREQRHHGRDRRQQKRFNNKVKELRMAVRSSLYRKASAGHVHEYGPEQRDDADADADADAYHRTCVQCGHRLAYEKM